LWRSERDFFDEAVEPHHQLTLLWPPAHSQKLLGVQSRTRYVSEFVVDPCMMALGKFGE
jgi:hypothetical protein